MFCLLDFAEKEELVGLVLTHVAQSDRERGCPPNQNQSPGRGQANPMDSLKQSCQNFFTNLSDNISDSLASFDTKSSSKSTSNSRHAPNDNGAPPPPTHIFEQPRVSTREIPTYASAGGAQQTPARTPSIHRTNSTEVAHVHVSPSTSSTHTATSPTATQEHRALATEAARLLQQVEPDNSECDCSDDEIITTFSERTSPKISDNSAGPASRPTLEISSAGLTPTTATIATATTATTVTTATTSTSPGYSKQGSLSSKVDACGADASSQSSFEELGAIGGISDESKATTDTNSSNLDQWQILEQTSSSQLPQQQQLLQDQQQQQLQVEAAIDEILQVTVQNEPQAPQRIKKVTRRRSEGYLNRRHQSSDDDDESPVGPLNGLVLSTLSEQPEPSITAVASSSCQRCGKNKTNIRRHVDKMRRHLENSQMSEADIKRELQEFLTYLEQRTKSLECSDADSHAVSPLSSIEAGAAGVARPLPITPTIEFSPTQDEHESHWEDDEGIHVYASPLGFEPPSSLDSRFVNLEEFEDR